MRLRIPGLPSPDRPSESITVDRTPSTHRLFSVSNVRTESSSKLMDTPGYNHPTKGVNRPELQQMLSDARENAFDVLLVLRVDRLSRRVGELALLADELSGFGVALRSVTESFDTASPSGKMMFQMLGMMAEFEQKSIVARTKMGMLKKTKSKSWPGGRVPLGYKFSAENGLEVQEDEALIIKKIFAQYTEGKDGSSAIARSLNDAGYRTKAGKKFNRKSILTVLRSPFYIGKFRWQKEDFESDHEPIISLATFDEV